VPNAPPQSAGSHSGACVPIRPSHLNRMKFGTSVTCAGIISVASSAINSASRPRKRTTANANAAIAQVISWPTVVRKAIFKLLKISMVTGRPPNDSIA
jgi:hypothetical protein